MAEFVTLPPRLAAVSELARPCRVLADVGTDHALLPISLIQWGNCDRAFACDVNPGPLRRAEASIKKYGLSDRVSLILSDGLKSVPEEYDSLVIAGMGGDLIARILYEHPPLCAKKLTLQPMTKPETLRRFLFRNGYSILRERAVAEGEKSYIVLSVARFPSEIPSDADCYLPHNLDCTPDALIYLEKLLLSRQKRLLGLLRADCPDPSSIALEEVLCQRLTALWQTYSRRIYDELNGTCCGH